MATVPHSRNWASGAFVPLDVPREPAKPTRFEIVVRQLRLDDHPECWVESPTLRMWAKKNKNKFYIPEELLESWDMHVVMED
jgi:hypothetical protein